MNLYYDGIKHYLLINSKLLLSILTILLIISYFIILIGIYFRYKKYKEFNNYFAVLNYVLNKFVSYLIFIVPLIVIIFFWYLELHNNLKDNSKYYNKIKIEYDKDNLKKVEGNLTIIEDKIDFQNKKFFIGDKKFFITEKSSKDLYDQKVIPLNNRKTIIYYYEVEEIDKTIFGNGIIVKIYADYP